VHPHRVILDLFGSVRPECHPSFLPPPLLSVPSSSLPFLFCFHTMHTCTMHHTQCTTHNAPHTMHHAQCTMHNAPCTMHHAQCTSFAFRPFPSSFAFRPFPSSFAFRPFLVPSLPLLLSSQPLPFLFHSLPPFLTCFFTPPCTQDELNQRGPK
jgi:hypothetical protein